MCDLRFDLSAVSKIVIGLNVVHVLEVSDV